MCEISHQMDTSLWQTYGKINVIHSTCACIARNLMCRSGVDDFSRRVVVSHAVKPRDVKGSRLRARVITLNGEMCRVVAVSAFESKVARQSDLNDEEDRASLVSGWSSRSSLSTGAPRRIVRCSSWSTTCRSITRLLKRQLGFLMSCARRDRETRQCQSKAYKRAKREAKRKLLAQPEVITMNLEFNCVCRKKKRSLFHWNTWM